MKFRKAGTTARTTYSTNALDNRADSLKGGLAEYRRGLRALVPALLCLSLSGDLLVSNEQQASRSEPSQFADQLKRALARKGADGLLLAGDAAQAVGYPRLALPLYTSAHAFAVDGYGAASSAVVTALNSRAEALSDLGRLEDALRDKNRLVQMWPDDPLSYERRAETLSRLRRYSEALQDYEASLRLNPAAVSANIGRALVLGQLGRPSDARDAYSEAIEINLRLAGGRSEEARLYTFRGLASYKLNDFAAAIDDFSRAIRIQPGWLRHYSRGCSYYGAGDYNAAIDDFSRAIELSPHEDRAFHWRGTAYFQLGRYEQALADDERAVALNPTDASAYIGRAMTHDKLGRPDRAFADYDQALRLDPGRVNAYRGRGWLYEQQGRPDLARLDYEEALKFLPSDPWLQRAVSRLEAARTEESGMHDQIVKAFRER